MASRTTPQKPFLGSSDPQAPLDPQPEAGDLEGPAEVTDHGLTAQPATEGDRDVRYESRGREVTAEQMRAEMRAQEREAEQLRASPFHAGERREVDLDLDRRQDAAEQQLRAAISTLGLPKLWERTLRAAGPAVSLATRQLVQALDPESPGGGHLTEDELEELADDAAHLFRRALREEFRGGGR
jgi:hypothetical protein